MNARFVVVMHNVEGKDVPLEYLEISGGGMGKDTVTRPATDADRDRYHEEYAEFQKMKDKPKIRPEPADNKPLPPQGMTVPNARSMGPLTEKGTKAETQGPKGASPESIAPRAGDVVSVPTGEGGEQTTPQGDGPKPGTDAPQAATVVGGDKPHGEGQHETEHAKAQREQRERDAKHKHGKHER